MKINPLTQAILDARASFLACSRRSFAAFAAADGDVPKIAPLMQLRPLGAASNEYELVIYGDIGDSWWGESVTAQSIVQQLAALPDTVTQINVRINSYGGSVSDGMAIYNVLKRNSAKKIGTVDGVAMSSASLIAMACDTLNMPEASLMMIHAPWGLAQGNASDMRIMADVLDTYAQAMSAAYASKTKKPKAEMLALLTDGQDHFYTGEQAVAAGFADAVIATAIDDENADADADAKARARNNIGLSRYLSSAPAAISAMAIAAARRIPKFAATAASNPAAKPAAASAPTPTKEENTMTPEELAAKARADADNAARVAAEAARKAQDDIKDRNGKITAALKPVMEIAGVRDLYTQALSDPMMTLDEVHAKALVLAGASVTPLGKTSNVEPGQDQLDKEIEAMGDVIAARCLTIARSPDGKRVPAPPVAASNPFRKLSLSAMAEHCVRATGQNTARMSRSEIAAAALMRPVAVAGHTTSDFTTLLGNSINRVLLATYTNANVTWRQFAKITDLADFRANQRLRMGSFDDLKAVNEAGNYEQGTFGDATAETIQATRKGRKLIVSREMIVNDDLQALADMSTMLGNAASRTVEKDVFALFALNSGNGPTMGDGNPLFDASHNNIAAVGGAPSVTTFDAARQQLANQKDISGNDFLDLLPSIWLGPNSLYGAANLLNINDYDPTVTNKFQVKNIVAGMLDKVLGTPRLSGTAWYVLTDPDIDRVFEVGFVDGQSTPRTDSIVDFDSDGVKWKVVLEYGVAATGWRGIVKNAGA